MPQITPTLVSQFREQWKEAATGFVQFPSTVLLPLGLTDSDRQFLFDPGLPSWVAPHMNFEFDGGSELPRPTDVNGQALVGRSNRLRMIGSTGENWPICLDPKCPGQILCMELTPPNQIRLLNSSVAQLAGSLLALAEAIEAALAFGAARREPDAWRRKLYPVEMDRALVERMRKLDPVAFEGSGYWSWYFRSVGRSDA